MKKRLSLSSLLHHDKLMMLVSLGLAIFIWSTVVYGPSNMEEREISGVPVSITLNDYASQTLNLRIIDGADATATVRVKGLHSAVGKLTAQDVTITADTGNVIKEGSYVLNLKAVSTGDYEIVDVVGSDGVSDTVSITCDVWREQPFAVEVDMPNLTVTDAEKYQFGTASASGAAVNEGQVTVAGPKSDISRINRVVATISDAATIEETAVYTAALQALDENGNAVDSVSFLKAEDAKVSVTVPVLMYRKATLTASVKNLPAGYKDVANLITVTPSTVELWGLPSELDEYVENIQRQIEVDFDKLTPDNLTRQIVLEETEGIRPVNSSETVELKVNLSNISTRTMEINLTKDNVSFINRPKGYSISLTQQKLSSVVLCGPAATLSRITPEDIRIVVDMQKKAVAGQREVIARITVQGIDTVWAVYGDADGIGVMVSVTEK